ncbi:MAG: hypothetical protein MUO59_07800 [Actinobacteria bacterium]|nr:hypothetical protein [Actinomycetota bacterium]
MKKKKKNILEISIVIILSIVIAGIAFFSMRLGRFVSIVIFGMGLVPIFVAYIFKIDLKKILPDIIFGIIDNILLIIPAIIGAELFGAAGALAGAVVGNAISDGIAGLFEGSISEWLRIKGIDSKRTLIGSSLGKMSGCLFIGIFLIFFK